jgi:hypothetical protein
MVSALVRGGSGLVNEEKPMIGSMKRLVWFVLLGLSFAVPGEILNQILARQNVAAF